MSIRTKPTATLTIADLPDGGRSYLVGCLLDYTENRIELEGGNV